MEKIINIGGKEVGFKASASFFLKYKMYFNTSGLKDLKKLQDFRENWDLEPVYRLVWTLAKCYDSTIPQLDEWVDSFGDDFKIMDILAECQPLITTSLQLSDQLNLKK